MQRIKICSPAWGIVDDLMEEVVCKFHHEGWVALQREKGRDVCLETEKEAGGSIAT